jgi:hypothetical protein
VRKEMVFDIKYAFGNRILECERNSWN